MIRNARRVKGKELASSKRLKRRGRNQWIVPSKTRGRGYYDVDYKAQSCSCPDFELNNRKCKHLFAIDYAVRGSFPDVNPLPRPTYPQDWTSYNQAQINEKEIALRLLRSLCDGIPQPSQHMGRPRMPLKDMAFAITMKIYGTLSGRRTSSDLREYEDKRLIQTAPHHATISKYLEDESLTEVLQNLIGKSARPLSALEEGFAADSTGFSSTTYSRWFDEKYGSSASNRDWIKLHLTTGVKSNIVTAAEVTEAYVHDNTQFEVLVKKTVKNFRMKRFFADKAYLSKKNLEVIAKRGAIPYIPFKSNTLGDGPEIWEKMYHLFQYKRKEFLQNYHQRSNVESTINMIKAKFGSNIRSRTWTSMKNELLAKVLCHNLAVLVQSIYEFKITPEFSGSVKS